VRHGCLTNPETRAFSFGLVAGQSPYREEPWIRREQRGATIRLARSTISRQQLQCAGV